NNNNNNNDNNNNNNNNEIALQSRSSQTRSFLYDIQEVLQEMKQMSNQYDHVWRACLISLLSTPNQSPALERISTTGSKPPMSKIEPVDNPCQIYLQISKDLQTRKPVLHAQVYFDSLSSAFPGHSMSTADPRNGRASTSFLPGDISASSATTTTTMTTTTTEAAKATTATTTTPLAPYLLKNQPAEDNVNEDVLEWLKTMGLTAEELSKLSDEELFQLLEEHNFDWGGFDAAYSPDDDVDLDLYGDDYMDEYFHD
ncbi:BEACH domain-containing protein, partial [Reticulomyxa filosa]